MSEHLGANLKLLCSHYRSISEVCRQLAINRAQFNKYLSGQSQPTPYNRKRIGDFFGVEDYELGLPPEQFARLIGARASAQPRQSSNDPLLRLLQPLRAEAGDLGPLFSGYFDTTSGPKRESASYARIAGAIGLPAAEILFLSDVVQELDAARDAGMRTLGLAREGGSLDGHPTVASFLVIIVLPVLGLIIWAIAGPRGNVRL